MEWTPQPQDGSWQVGVRAGRAWRGDRPYSKDRLRTSGSRIPLPYFPVGFPAFLSPLLPVLFMICLIFSILWGTTMTHGQTWAIRPLGEGSQGGLRADPGLRRGLGGQSHTVPEPRQPWLAAGLLC